jgi:hypothetical protein
MSDKRIRHKDGRAVIENGENKGKAGDGQFLKAWNVGQCINQNL